MRTSRVRRAAAFLLTCAGLLAAGPAAAHPFSASSLKMHVAPDRLRVFLSLDGPTLVAVLEKHLGGDGGLVTPESMAAGRDSILSYVDARLAIEADGRACEPGDLRRFAVTGGGRRVRILRDYSCPEPPREVAVRDDVFLEDAGGHRLLAFFYVGDRVLEHELNADERVFRFDATPALEPGAPVPSDADLDLAGSGSARPPTAGPESPPPVRGARAPRLSFWGFFARFLGEGVLHILGGIDHVLFVVALVVVVASFRELAIVVTSFTLAHSVTLALGALDVVTPPPRLVESLIALSIVYVGVENVARDRPKGRHAVTFAFGLMHGFGFSTVLRDLGIRSGEGLVPSLLAFNVGVEIGQLLVVAPLFPAARWLARRNGPRYRSLANAASGAVAAVALVWLVERVFGIAIFPWTA